VVVILSAFAKIHYKLTLSLYCTLVTCFLRENLGGSEKSRLCCGSGGSEKNRIITGAVDYRIWGLMQQRLYKTPVRDTIDLKKRLVDTWASIPQCVVDEAVDQWTARLRACLKAKGRQFEHLL